jgi:hypothetical protein
MNRTLSVWASLAAFLLASICARVCAQEGTAAAAPAAKPAAQNPPAPATPSTRSPYRPIAPGVMKTVDPMRVLDETVSRHDIVELLAVDPKFDWAKDIPFRHDIWVVDFQFKPMRMIKVDIPQPSGKMQQKLIWYMVYSVTNTGKTMHPVEEVDLPYETAEKKQLYKVVAEDRPIQFTPEFLLEAQVRLDRGGTVTKVYPDRVIPVAIGPIRSREDPNRRFLTSVEISRKLAVGETQWGVATWEDIDPKTYQFSVYVVGLTNAYRWKDDPGEYKPGDMVGKGRKLYRKILKLNFWRPGDPYFEHEEEIRYGVPGGVDYEWVYR